MHRLSLAIFLLLNCLPPVRAAENGGVITGTVRLKGKPPVITKVFPASDLDVCGERARAAQVLMLGTNQTVRDAIVYLAGTARDRKSNIASPAIVLDQRDCEFVPRIQIVRSGVPLILRNSDPVLHVVRIDSMSGTNAARTLLNVATPYAGFEKAYRLANFREPTLLQVASGNGKAWMAGYIAVIPHPWAVLTDENGRFTLRNVPPGPHKIYAWHEVLGTLLKDVRVNSDRGATVDFQFTAPP
jgi:hypothetical protein